MWQKYPLVRLAVPFLLGMSGASALMGTLDWRLDMMFVVMASLLMVLVVCHNVFAHAPLFRHIFSAAAFLLIFLFGATLYIIRYRNVATAVDVNQTTFCGVVATQPWQTARSVALDMTTDDGASLRIYLQPSDTHPPQALRRGDTLLIQPLHLNLTCPHLQADTSFYATYHRQLFYRGTSATAYVLAGHWQNRAPARRDTTWNERLHAYYLQSSLDSTTLSMVEALTLGRREGLSRPLRTHYAAAGVSHVLALSGMHLGLIIGLLDFVLFRFLLYEQRRWAMLSVIPVLWIFAFVAGMPPSLVRATVMATFFQLGFALGRPKMLPNLLALAAIAMLCWNPLLLNHVGFQLSFLSMVAIAVVAPSRHWLTATLTVTLACTLITAPLVAYHFGQLPLYGWVTNLIVPPLVMLLMYLAVAWLLLVFWPAAQAALGQGLDALVRVQNTVVETIAEWPASSIEFHPSAWVTVLLYVVLLAVFWIIFPTLGKKHTSA